MSTGERGGLKAAFSNFKKSDSDATAELKLLGRTIPDDSEQELKQNSYQVATTPLPVDIPRAGLTPRPLLKREVVRQLSFRCPVSISGELRRKAAFNQLEQQEIIIEGLKRVLGELPDPPVGWEP
jgi:hypothetical protein